MTPERWQEIERVYHEARQREPTERAAYLDAVCATDATLRAEVESLLRYDQHAVQFIEPAPAQALRSPIASMMARMRDAAVPGRFAGQVLGSYEVKSLIAAGGMGEVYRAVDTRLTASWRSRYCRTTCPRLRSVANDSGEKPRSSPA